MADLRLPISLIISFNSPIRRRTLQVDSLTLFLRKSSLTCRPSSLSKSLPTRIFHVTCHSSKTIDDIHHDHHHNHDHDHGHNHHHHHYQCHHGHHHHNGSEYKLTKTQKAFIDFAKAIKWTEIADLLREHLEVCCFSTALLLAAAVSPYLVPKASVKLIQQVLSLVAFPLVGVSISFRLFFVIIYFWFAWLLLTSSMLGAAKHTKNSFLIYS